MPFVQVSLRVVLIYNAASNIVRGEMRIQMAACEVCSVVEVASSYYAMREMREPLVWVRRDGSALRQFDEAEEGCATTRRAATTGLASATPDARLMLFYAARHAAPSALSGIEEAEKPAKAGAARAKRCLNVLNRCATVRHGAVTGSRSAEMLTQPARYKRVQYVLVTSRMSRDEDQLQAATPADVYTREWGRLPVPGRAFSAKNAAGDASRLPVRNRQVLRHV